MSPPRLRQAMVVLPERRAELQMYAIYQSPAGQPLEFPYVKRILIAEKSELILYMVRSDAIMRLFTQQWA